MNAVTASTADTESHCVDWMTVDCCPSCGTQPSGRMTLPEDGYVFGDERIAFPKGGIAVAYCGACGLIYKTVLPMQKSLASVFERQAAKKWMEPYDFDHEVRELQRLAGDGPVDLLDVGSGNGSLLEAWAHRSAGSGGRRSALDVIRHPSCAARVDGEYIRGLIDSETLRWTGEPYDIVTLFDVLEHLYSPRVAFRNLSQLVRKNGLVVVESGNAASSWPLRYGVNQWWYVRLFEHHVFWTRRSLEYIARQYGFSLLMWRELRHKTRVAMPFLKLVNDSSQVALYRLMPRVYSHLAPLIGKYWTQPWSPFTQDHFRVVMRKL